MAKIEITKTDLVGHGKYNENGILKEVLQVNSPFQVIETIKEIRVTREARKSGVKRAMPRGMFIGMDRPFSAMIRWMSNIFTYSYSESLSLFFVSCVSSDVCLFLCLLPNRSLLICWIRG